MKKSVLFFLSALLLAALVFALASCSDKEPPAPQTYDVTFIVGGESVTVSVESGQMPVYPGGTPKKPATSLEGYRFTGWDVALAPVSADATYTAQFETVESYAVRWVFPHDVITIYTAEGEIPEFVGSTDTPSNAEYDYIFTGWDKTPVAVTADNARTAVYKALYTSIKKSYTVVFKAGETVLSTETLPYGTIPSYAGTVSDKDGKKFSGWAPFVTPVSEDVTYTALYANPNADGTYFKLPDSVIQSCLAQGLIDYDHHMGQKTNAFNGTTATALLLVEEHFNPGSEQIISRVLEQFRSLVSGGKEPDLMLGSEWSPANCASMIALAKHTPSVWDRLSSAERDKLDFLMKLLTYAAAFATNDCNDYRTTLAMDGNYNKEWNPNYRFTNVVPMIAAGEYFGSAAAVDEILLAFDYDATLAKCREYGFTNVVDILSAVPKDLLENGGTAYSASGAALGSGLGVRQPYVYKTFTLDESYKILNSLFELNYNGGAVVSSYTDNDGNLVAYIEGKLISPYEGMIGMYYELGGGDAGGVRSSAGYCQADFNIATVTLTMMMTLDSYDVEEHMSQALQNRVWVGNNDLLFKLKHGYWSYANGVSTGMTTGGAYALITTLEVFWNEVLADDIIDYVNLNKYTLYYEFPNGSTLTSGADEATFTLDDTLPQGYVWFDGTKYYNGGASYLCAGEGDVTLRAVLATGVDDGAYLIKTVTSNITIAAGNATATAQSFCTISELMSGKILTILTISSPEGQTPDTFQFMHKHLNAPNPASSVFSCKNGALYTPQNVKICDYTGSSVTLAISYDTAGTVGNIFILKDGSYEFVTTYTYSNAEGTLGRLGYFYIEASKQNDTLTDHKVNYTASYYYGLSHPIDKPVKYPLTLTEGTNTTNTFYVVGGDGIIPSPSRTDGFRGWMNERGEMVTSISPDFFGALSLHAVFEGEGFYYSYVVNGEVSVEKSETLSITLSAELLPSGYMWFDGEKYYNAGYEYTISATENSVLTAVPGAGINGASQINKLPVSGSITLVEGAESDATYNYTSPGIFSGKFFAELTFATGSYTTPSHFRINYKHTGATFPESTLLHCTDGKIYAWNVDGTAANDTYICDYADGLRLGIGYDTTENIVRIYYYDEALQGWKLGATFSSANELDSSGRALYFYMPRNRNPVNAGETVGTSFTFDAYFGITAPVSAPLITE